jgi:hypothetical protein
MRDPTDHIRKVPTGGGNRNKKNSLQGNIAELGTNIYQMGLKIKVIGSPEEHRQ